MSDYKDTGASSANRDHGEIDPRLDTLVGEISNAALTAVPESEAATFTGAMSGMLHDLQQEVHQGQGRLELDKLGMVASRYNASAEFTAAGVTIMPFVSPEGGFALVTAVGPSKQQQLVHVAAGASWDDVLGDIRTAGRGQGLDRYDRPRTDEDAFGFQRRALYTLQSAMRDRQDSFTSVNRAAAEVSRYLPGRTAMTFGLPNYTSNIIRNLAYAYIDGSDIMGVAYDVLVMRYGQRIDRSSARAIVGYEVGVEMAAILNNMVAAASSK